MSILSISRQYERKLKKIPLEKNLELIRMLLVFAYAMPYYFLVRSAQAE
tara:strand:+ start:362 stop:508 length:147 start_codon:yes stop_codon:yes gene_type:complete